MPPSIRKRRLLKILATSFVGLVVLTWAGNLLLFREERIRTWNFKSGSEGWVNIPHPGFETIQYNHDAYAGGRIKWSREGGPKGGPYVYTEGPWWVDSNHGLPGGTGDLNYLAGSGQFVDQLPTSLVKFQQKLNSVFGRDHYRLRNADIRNRKLSFWMKGTNLDLKGSHCVVWVIAHPLSPGGKQVNYAFSSQPLDKQIQSGEWEYVELTLVNDQSAWTDMGSTTSRNTRYGSAPVDDVLSRVLAFGVFLYPLKVRTFTNPEKTNYLYDPKMLPTGKLSLADVSLSFRLH